MEGSVNAESRDRRRTQLRGYSIRCEVRESYAIRGSSCFVAEYVLLQCVN